MPKLKITKNNKDIGLSKFLYMQKNVRNCNLNLTVELNLPKIERLLYIRKIHQSN